VAAETFPVDPRSVAAARRLASVALDGHAPGVVEDAVLLTSELVTNAVRHAGSTVRVVVAVDDRLVRVEVHDDSPVHPVVGPAPSTATGGRGMPMVDVLARRWGVTAGADGGKAVWFELGVSGARG
jgi:anti-sigma regulatory factor (Ser/Thr protein kinase)